MQLACRCRRSNGILSDYVPDDLFPFSRVVFGNQQTESLRYLACASLRPESGPEVRAALSSLDIFLR